MNSTEPAALKLPQLSDCFRTALQVERLCTINESTAYPSGKVCHVEISIRLSNDFGLSVPVTAPTREAFLKAAVEAALALRPANTKPDLDIVQATDGLNSAEVMCMAERHLRWVSHFLGIAAVQQLQEAA